MITIKITVILILLLVIIPNPLYNCRLKDLDHPLMQFSYVIPWKDQQTLPKDGYEYYVNDSFLFNLF